MPYVISPFWTKDDVEKLQQLISSGASEIQIAATLNRQILAIRVKAKRLGISITVQPQGSMEVLRSGKEIRRSQT